MAAWPAQLSRGGRGLGDTGAVPYDPTIYLGSAAHYRYGRPAYSPELEAVLAQAALVIASSRSAAANSCSRTSGIATPRGDTQALLPLPVLVLQVWTIVHIV